MSNILNKTRTHKPLKKYINETTYTPKNLIEIEETLANTFFTTEVSKLTGPELIPGAPKLQYRQNYYPGVAKLYKFYELCASVKINDNALFRRHYLADFGRLYISNIVEGRSYLSLEEVQSAQFQNVLKETVIPINEKYISHKLLEITFNNVIH